MSSITIDHSQIEAIDGVQLGGAVFLDVGYDVNE